MKAVIHLPGSARRHRLPHWAGIARVADAEGQGLFRKTGAPFANAGILPLLLSLSLLLALVFLYWQEIPQRLTHSASIKTSAASEANSGTFAAEAEVVIVNAFEGVRVRSEPSQEGQTVGALKTGDRLKMVDGPVSVDGVQWVKVSTWWVDRELAGWIPLDYVEQVKR